MGLEGLQLLVVQAFILVRNIYATVVSVPITRSLLSICIYELAGDVPLQCEAKTDLLSVRCCGDAIVSGLRCSSKKK